MQTVSAPKRRESGTEGSRHDNRRAALRLGKRGAKMHLDATASGVGSFNGNELRNVVKCCKRRKFGGHASHDEREPALFRSANCAEQNRKHGAVGMEQCGKINNRITSFQSRE